MASPQTCLCMPANCLKRHDDKPKRRPGRERERGREHKPDRHRKSKVKAGNGKAGDFYCYCCMRVKERRMKRRQGVFDRQNDRLGDGTEEREKEKARKRGRQGEQSYFVALAQLAAVNSYTIPRSTALSLLLAEFHSIRRHQSVLKSCCWWVV